MRRLALILAASLGTATAACSRGIESPTLPVTDTNVAGTFNLRTANGLTPPYTAIVTTTESWALTSDQIIIAPNSTWVDTTNYDVVSLVDGSERTQFTSTAGTYSLANGQIQFVMTSGGSTIFFGAVTGNTLNVLFNGRPYVYVR